MNLVWRDTCQLLKSSTVAICFKTQKNLISWVLSRKTPAPLSISSLTYHHSPKQCQTWITLVTWRQAACKPKVLLKLARNCGKKTSMWPTITLGYSKRRSGEMNKWRRKRALWSHHSRTTLSSTSSGWTTSQTTSQRLRTKSFCIKSKSIDVTCRVHEKARPVDKTNFKKKNPFNSYVNSMFNQGVFLHPWQDMVWNQLQKAQKI